MNPENKCAFLYSQNLDTNISIDEMIEIQKKLQKFLSEKDKALNYDTASFKDRIDNLTVQWRNMSLEFAELLERLPFKEWRSYDAEALKDFVSEEQRLETFYELIDIFHFFLNMCLCLKIDGPTFRRLFVTKNKENIERQKRGY